METIKEEKKADLEQLLNSLIEKGWKPMGYEAKFVKQQKNGKIHIYSSHGYYSGYRETLRTLTSKDSGLWQFCCKNRLTNRDGDWSKNAERDEDGVIDRDCLIFSSDYEYWLIESSLKDESELEDFILDNVKIDE